jgi:hypothetical protein
VNEKFFSYIATASAGVQTDPYPKGSSYGRRRRRRRRTAHSNPPGPLYFQIGFVDYTVKRSSEKTSQRSKTKTNVEGFGLLFMGHKKGKMNVSRPHIN